MSDVFDTKSPNFVHQRRSWRRASPIWLFGLVISTIARFFENELLAGSCWRGVVCPLVVCPSLETDKRLLQQVTDIGGGRRPEQPRIEIEIEFRRMLAEGAPMICFGVEPMFERVGSDPTADRRLRDRRQRARQSCRAPAHRSRSSLRSGLARRSTAGGAATLTSAPMTV